MPRFSSTKADYYQNTQIRVEDPLSALSEPKAEELLIFVVDDDPHFLQILNTNFSKLELKTEKDNALYKFNVKNFTTGKSCIKNLTLNPDLIILNYYINKGLPDALKGKEIIDEIAHINPNQKTLILNNIGIDLRDAFVENGLRDYIIKDNEALKELNRLVINILNS